MSESDEKRKYEEQEAIKKVNFLSRLHPIIPIEVPASYEDEAKKQGMTLLQYVGYKEVKSTELAEKLANHFRSINSPKSPD